MPETDGFLYELMRSVKKDGHNYSVEKRKY